VFTATPAVQPANPDAVYSHWRRGRTLSTNRLVAIGYDGARVRPSWSSILHLTPKSNARLPEEGSIPNTQLFQVLNHTFSQPSAAAGQAIRNHQPTKSNMDVRSWVSLTGSFYNNYGLFNDSADHVERRRTHPPRKYRVCRLPRKKRLRRWIGSSWLTFCGSKPWSETPLGPLLLAPHFRPLIGFTTDVSVQISVRCRASCTPAKLHYPFTRRAVPLF